MHPLVSISLSYSWGLLLTQRKIWCVILWWLVSIQKLYWTISVHLSVIREKGGSPTGGNKKTKHARFSEKTSISYPPDTHTYVPINSSFQTLLVLVTMPRKRKRNQDSLLIAFNKLERLFWCLTLFHIFDENISQSFMYLWLVQMLGLKRWHSPAVNLHYCYFQGTHTNSSKPCIFWI